MRRLHRFLGLPDRCQERAGPGGWGGPGPEAPELPGRSQEPGKPSHPGRLPG